MTIRLSRVSPSVLPALVLVLRAGAAASINAAAGTRSGATLAAHAGFVAFPSTRTGTTARGDGWKSTAPARTPERVSKLPRRIFSADPSSTREEEVAAPSAEPDAKRKATKSALLGVFGEEVRGDDAGDAAAVGTANNADAILACPYTLSELTDSVRSYGGAGPAPGIVSYKSSEKMPDVKFQVQPDFVDFAEPGKPIWKLSRGEAIKEGTFQLPVVTWLYERGWRRNFNAAGFPGIDEEFQMVSEFFSSTGADGGAIIDLSCGTGLMMRRMVASGRYSRVIGGDLSSTMLSEAARRFKEEALGVPELIRCDVSRLPVKTESLDGVHAGAALHCWSKLEESLSEVYRVLKPGRGLFATTFTNDVNPMSNKPSKTADGYKFFEVEELEGYLLGAGFSDVKVVREGNACLIVTAKKSP